MTLEQVKQETKQKFNKALEELKDKQMAYLMLEVTGIYDYMFNLHKTKGSLKRLRGRSYSCVLILKAVTFYLLNKLTLPLDNLLDEGGELAGILFKSGDVDKVRDFLKEMRADLVKKYDGKINILYAIKDKVTKADLFENTEFIKKLNEELYKNELQSFKGLTELFDEITFEVAGHVSTCNYCVRDFSGKDECSTCKHEKEIGDTIVKDSYLVSAYSDRLNVGDDFVSFFENQVAFRFCKSSADVSKTLEELKDEAQVRHVASINDTPLYYAIPGDNISRSTITIGNAARLKRHGGIWDLDSLAENAAGAQYLASLKIDVDNFGKSTSSSTLFNTAVLSYCIKDFFQRKMDRVIEGHWGYTIYGAGDDLFVIGPWDQMIDLAKKINRDFQKQDFVQNNPASKEHKLTLTGAIATLSRAVTIPTIHKLTDQAESEAKDKKDCLSVFGRLFNWNRLEELDSLIKRVFIEEDTEKSTYRQKTWKYREPFGNSLIYRLYQLTRQLEKGDLTAVPRIFYILRDHPDLLKKSTASIGLYECLLGLSPNRGDREPFFCNFHFIAAYCALITRKKKMTNEEE